jgi:hypothetical protein
MNRQVFCFLVIVVFGLMNCKKLRDSPPVVKDEVISAAEVKLNTESAKPYLDDALISPYQQFLKAKELYDEADKIYKQYKFSSFLDDNVTDVEVIYDKGPLKVVKKDGIVYFQKNKDFKGDFGVLDSLLKNEKDNIGNDINITALTKEN